MIKGSFKSCGITVATDATEDDIIHCFKEEQPCADGKTILAHTSRQLLQQLEDTDDNDSFEDDDEDEDDEEAECNEIRIDEDLIHEESNISDSDNCSQDHNTDYLHVHDMYIPSMYTAILLLIYLYIPCCTYYVILFKLQWQLVISFLSIGVWKQFLQLFTSFVDL